jgi:F420H(2)-dependent quinone reductase
MGRSPHPNARVEICTETCRISAQVANSTERRQLLDRLARLSPQVAGVVAYTQREIPVVVLDQTEAPT